MKHAIKIVILSFLFSCQKKITQKHNTEHKEENTIYFLFDETSHKKCTIDHNTYIDKRYETRVYYRKHYDSDFKTWTFCFCDTEFEYHTRRYEVELILMEDIKKYNIITVEEYNKNKKYWRKQINIIGKISDEEALIYKKVNYIEDEI